MKMMSAYNVICMVLAAAVLSACSSSSASGFRSAKSGKVESAGVALIVQPGSGFGDGLTADEKSGMALAEQQALDFGKTGEEVAWTGGRSDISGSVTASQPYRVGQSNCRRFTHALQRKGVVSQASGTACRKEGGSWQLIS